mgnify:CR=1 FL=1
MDINVAKLEKWVAIIACAAVIGFGGYLAYVVFFTGPKVESNPTLAGVNASLFGPKIQKAAAALTDNNQKILLKKKNLEFSETALYKSFQDLPVDVPLSDSRGRPDPFVPYASP